MSLWGDSRSFVAALWEGSSLVEFCLELLGFRGFSQDRLQISFLVGGISWGSIHLTFGI